MLQPRAIGAEMYEAVHHLHLKLTTPTQRVGTGMGAYRGHLTSPSMIFPETDSSKECALSLHLTKLLRERRALKLEKELALERWRKENKPELVSRLSCIYVWADRSVAESCSRLLDEPRGPF